MALPVAEPVLDSVPELLEDVDEDDSVLLEDAILWNVSIRYQQALEYQTYRRGSGAANAVGGSNDLPAS